MRNISQTIFVGVLFLFFVKVQASSPTFETPAYGGSGCPARTASAVLNSDKTILNFILDRFEVEAGKSVQLIMNRKDCMLSIPIHVPQGYSVRLKLPDFTGFNSIPSGAKAQLDIVVYWSGFHTPNISETFNGPLNSDFITRNEMFSNSIDWSACGKDTALKVRMTMTVNTNSEMEDVVSLLNPYSSNDFSRSHYQLQWKRCD